MSEKNSGTNYAPKAIDTLVGAGMRIEGDIACTGVLRVQGEILGNVSCHENPNATLMVDSAGNVSGTVRASRIITRGRISGPVRSPQSIEIHQGGSIAGDVSYKRIAIHAGGIVDGLLNPLVAVEADNPATEDRAQGPDRPTGEAFAADATEGKLGKRFAVAVIIAVAVGAGVWVSRNPEVIGRHSDDGALGSESALKTADAPASPAPIAQPPRPDSSSTPPAQTEPVAAVEAAPPPAPRPAEKTASSVVAVRGINPNRPPGVFLLVSNEQSVLYRKKNDDSGEGDRVVVSGGEKVSVAFASDELIRVAQGRDVVILYQGKKVPRDIIESGAWISFVPR